MRELQSGSYTPSRVPESEIRKGLGLNHPEIERCIHSRLGGIDRVEVSKLGQYEDSIADLET